MHPHSHAAWTAQRPAGGPGARALRQAALAMVLRYYGAAPAALREVDAVYDSVLRGSDGGLGGAARRAGFEADVATLTPDSLIDL